MKMNCLMVLFLILTSCFTRSSNAIEELGEQVLKRKEGIDIQLTPIEENKEKKLVKNYERR